MNKIISITVVLFIILMKFQNIIAQPSSEVYLFHLVDSMGNLTLKNGINVSNKIGYDNQPSFLNDDELVYSSTFDGQTDLMKFNILSKENTRLTNTPESEFSPKITPDKKYISAVLLKDNGDQLIIKYPIKNGEPKIIESDQKIGYYCWLDKKTIFSYVVGSPSSLQEWNVKKSTFKIIMMNPGRSISKCPFNKTISFIHKESDDVWYLNSYNPETDKVNFIKESLPGAEDMTWATDGTAYLTKGLEIYKYHPKIDQDWNLVANMKDFGLSNATRLSISPNGKYMAIVIDEN